ncbi:MAG: SCO6745 family protein [Acidimicrobiales bacterium]
MSTEPTSSENPGDEGPLSVDGPMSIDEVMAATAIPILEFGRAWMMSPASGERAAELGLAPGFGFWVNGRAGAMGEVGADVAAAAIGFMAPDRVAELWGVRADGLSALDIAVAYAAMAAEASRPKLASMSDEELNELTALCDKIAAAALPSTGALFAGWRTLPRPGDPAGDATVALNMMRELRGGAHLSAVHAAGLGPHGAIMSVDDPVRGGPAGAERFGWTAPHPEPDTASRAEAERLTSDICRPAFAALDNAERHRFVALVTQARAALDD